MRAVTPSPLFVSREIVASRLRLEDLIPAIEEGFRAFHAGRSQLSPVTSLHLPEVNGETHIRAGYFTDGKIICVKVANFFFDNPRRGLPTLDCVMVISSHDTGRVRAVICDGGLVSDMRTAAASAVAANILARNDAATLGLVGAGNQAYWHAIALRHVRAIGEIKVWSRTSSRATETAARITATAGVSAVAAGLEEVAGCDVIVTATPARQAILDTQRLAPGACVIAMGADAPGKRELGPAVINGAACVVADSLPRAKSVGELQWVREPYGDLRVVELGAVLANEVRGREGEERIIFDSTGIAFEDVVAASMVLERIDDEVEPEHTLIV